MRNRNKVIRRLLVLAAIVLFATAGCASGSTDHNRYNAVPVSADGVQYNIAGTPENDMNPDSPRNDVDCFRVTRTWQSGALDNKEFELGTYCKVQDQK